MLEQIETTKPNSNQTSTFAPMGFTGILDATFSLYRNKFLLFFGIASIYFILIALQEGIVVYFLEKSNTVALDNFISDIDTFLDNLVDTLCTGVIVIASSRIYLGRPATIQTVLRQFRYRFSAYLGSSLLYLMSFVILILESIQVSGPMSMLMLLYMSIICVFLIRWILYGPVILLEEYRAGQAFGRSRTLVHGTWRRVFGIISAILLLHFGIAYILSNSFCVILALFGIIQDGNLMETVTSLYGLKYINTRPTSLTLLIIYGVYHVVDTFLLPIYAIGITLLYFDLRIRKEGLDIEISVSNSKPWVS